MKKFVQYPITLLAFASLFMFSSVSPLKAESQRIERHVIMFKIIGNITYDQVQEIDAKLSQKDGVLASRTNPESNIYFSFTLKSKDLTEADFKAWFKELGYEISCFDKVVEGEGVSKTNDEFENC